MTTHTVYVVCCGYDWEGNNVQAIFSTGELAIAYCKKRTKRDPYQDPALWWKEIPDAAGVNGVIKAWRSSDSGSTLFISSYVVDAQETKEKTTPSV